MGRKSAAFQPSFPAGGRHRVQRPHALEDGRPQRPGALEDGRPQRPGERPQRHGPQHAHQDSEPQRKARRAEQASESGGVVGHRRYHLDFPGPLRSGLPRPIVEQRFTSPSPQATRAGRSFAGKGCCTHLSAQSSFQFSSNESLRDLFVFSH